MVKPSPKFSICRMQIFTVSSGICLVMLSLTLAFADNSAKADRPSSNLDLILLPDKKSSILYPSYGSHIRIDPSVPTPDDVIRIIVSGEWIDVCVPRYQSHQIVGNMIRIEAVASLLGACIPVELPRSWSFTVEVGPLPIGLYTVEVYLVDPYFWWRPPILYDTTSFMVATERLYLPVILRNQ